MSNSSSDDGGVACDHKQFHRSVQGVAGAIPFFCCAGFISENNLHKKERVF